jgi:hypothetical protein
MIFFKLAPMILDKLMDRLLQYIATHLKYIFLSLVLAKLKYIK